MKDYPTIPLDPLYPQNAFSLFTKAVHKILSIEFAWLIRWWVTPSRLMASWELAHQHWIENTSWTRFSRTERPESSQASWSPHTGCKSLVVFATLVTWRKRSKKTSCRVCTLNSIFPWWVFQDREHVSHKVFSICLAELGSENVIFWERAEFMQGFVVLGEVASHGSLRWGGQFNVGGFDASSGCLVLPIHELLWWEVHDLFGSMTHELRYHTGPMVQIQLNPGGFYGVSLTKMKAAWEHEEKVWYITISDTSWNGETQWNVFFVEATFELSAWGWWDHYQ